MANIKLEIETSTENKNEVQAISALFIALAGNPETVKTSVQEATKTTPVIESVTEQKTETPAEKRKRLAAEKKASEDAAKTESENNENAIADAVEGTETTTEEDSKNKDVDYTKLRAKAKELLTQKATLDGAKDKVRAKLAELNAKGISGLKDEDVEVFIEFLEEL